MDNYAYQPEENNGRPPFAIARYPQANNNGHNSHLVEVNTRAKLFKKPAFYKRISIVLLIIALIFLIGLIVLLVMYFRPKPKICTSSECLRSATNLKYSLDLSVDPCQDFYQFTCGKWSEEHPNHGWYPTFSTFSTITEKINIASMSFFETEPTADEPLAVKSSRDLYKSCMDVDAIDELGLSVVYKFLEKSELPVVPNFFVKPKDEQKDFTFNWLRAETISKKVFAMDVFIGFLVDANIYNRSLNVMYIGAPGQKCPLPSPVKNKKNIHSSKTKHLDDDNDYDGPFTVDTLVVQIRTSIFKFVVQTIMKNNSLEMPSDDLLDDAADMINNITNYIDELSFKYSEVDDYQYRPNSFEDFQKKTDEELIKSNIKMPDIWIKYVNYMFEGTNVTIDPSTDLMYTLEVEEPYLPKILIYLSSIPEIYLELYMWWVTVYAMIINTTSDIVEYITDQTSTYYTGGNPVLRSRSLECAGLVNNYMGMAVSYAIADRNFENTTKPKVEKMIKEIKEAFVDKVNSLKWMDASTKTATLEKSDEMVSFIGFPEWLFQKGALDNYYKDIEISPDKYLENMLNFLTDYYPGKLALLRKNNERNWSTDPTNVNAFNSFTDNAINVPMAILNYPMYNLGLEVLNYGSIGAILGHELTHGFDNTGRKHDKFGNYVQWWSNKTIETFENMTQCFVEQYDNFTIEGVEGHVNGKKTLGENLADNGGINQAFLAYRKYVNEYGEEPILPGFENYTNSQLFFIAYGSIWCETMTAVDLKDQLEYDEHSPNSVRVLGTLQNSDDFVNAFKCPKGSFMNPRKKCKIW